MLRGKFFLCQFMPPKKDARRLESDPDNEPNFYQISAVYPLPEQESSSNNSSSSNNNNNNAKPPALQQQVQGLDTTTNATTPALSPLIKTAVSILASNASGTIGGKELQQPQIATTITRPPLPSTSPLLPAAPLWTRTTGTPWLSNQTEAILRLLQQQQKQQQQQSMATSLLENLLLSNTKSQGLPDLSSTKSNDILKLLLRAQQQQDKSLHLPSSALNLPSVSLRFPSDSTRSSSLEQILMSLPSSSSSSSSPLSSVPSSWAETLNRQSLLLESSSLLQPTYTTEDNGDAQSWKQMAKLLLQHALSNQQAPPKY